MIRALIQYLTNKNAHQLVEKLSDSYLMRRAAQIAVSIFYRTKSIAQEASEERIKDMNPEKMKSFFDKFQKNVKEEIEKVKSELEEKSKKN
jgi:mediator of RNA polymerase II transcription subunit 9